MVNILFGFSGNNHNMSLEKVYQRRGTAFQENKEIQMQMQSPGKLTPSEKGLGLNSEEKFEERREKVCSGQEMNTQDSWVPPAELTPSHKVLGLNLEERCDERREKVCSVQEMNSQDSWVPGTPAKLVPRKQPPGMIETAWNEAPTSSKGSSGEEIKSFYVSVEAGKEKDQSSNAAGSGFKVSGDSSAALTHEQVITGMPEDFDFLNSEFLASGDLNKGLESIDAWDPQLRELLSSSFDIPVAASQQSAKFSTPQDAVDRTNSPVPLFSDSGIDKDTKEPDTQNFSPAHSLCSCQQNEIGTEENLQSDTNTTEHCQSQDGQKNVQEEVASRVEVQNLNNQSDDVEVQPLNNQADNVNSGRRGPKKKPKRKKHRPKVLVDGKPKKAPKPPRTPKLATPKRASSKENGSSRKRKKSSKKDSPSEDSDIDFDIEAKKRKRGRKSRNNDNSDAINEVADKTCRRALNFDLENQSQDEKSAMVLATPQVLINAMVEATPQVDECLKNAMVVATPQVDECLKGTMVVAAPQVNECLKGAMVVATPQVSECLNVSEQCSQHSPTVCKKKRSRNVRKQCGQDFPTICKKKRSRRRRRLNTLFMRVLGSKEFPTKRRQRSRRLPRKCFKQAASDSKMEDVIVDVPEASKDTTNNNAKIPSLVDLEIHIDRREESPLKHEDLSLTTNLTGSQEVLKNPLNYWLADDSRSIQEVSQDQSISSQEPRIAFQEVLQELGICFGGVVQEQRTGLEQALQEQIILSQNQGIGSQEVFQSGYEEVLPIGSQVLKDFETSKPEDLWHIPRLGGQDLVEFFQEQGYNSAVQNFLPEQEYLWFTGSQEVPQGRTSIIDGAIQPMKQDCNAIEPVKQIDGPGPLVPYQGPNNGSGALVPYKRRRKPKRAKVLLDGESERMWDQLIKKEYIGKTDGLPEEERENHWRREREVCKGRVDSFIARMHLILGDRRFKPWKGSIVDSVVGVFLTQNVSDNLSSSAYMSLAAKFPIRIRSTSDSNSESHNSPESIASNGTVYDSNGNMYYVTEPEPDMTTPLTNEIPLPYLEIGTKGQSLVLEELKDTKIVKEAFVAHMFEDSTEEIQSSPNMESCISFQASTSERISNLNSDTGSSLNSPSHSHLEMMTKDLQQQPQDAASTPKKIGGKGSKLGEHKVGDQTKMTPQKKKKDSDSEPKDWELIRKMYSSDEQRNSDHMDSVDWDAVRCADVNEIAELIKERGQHNNIAARIKDFLNSLVEKHNGIDLEWLRNTPPDLVKEYLRKIPGIGLKSVECVRLLTLHHVAFPVDTNVARISVRLGWVPIQPLPEELQIHLLEEYPMMDHIQKYLWPRLCCLDQRTLYELHYQMITFGKVFCTKRSPNCGACPLRGECRHFASAFASAKLALPGLPEKGIVNAGGNNNFVHPIPFSSSNLKLENQNQSKSHEPIIEVPPSPEPSSRVSQLDLEEEPQCIGSDLEELCVGDIEDIPTIKLQEREFRENLQNFMEINNLSLQDSRALVTLTAEAASIPVKKLKNVSRLRTEHLAYVLPDNHNLLQGFERRELDDPCPYLLVIWSPGETPNSIEPPKNRCNSFEESKLCNEQTCCCCNRVREQDADIVRGTILIPCRTANRGRFPLNGTYFQVNEVFADHETSLQPIHAPRSTIANLPTQTAYFGSSATHIMKGLDIQEIQKCFWRGFICVRGFDRKTCAPRPLLRRLHCQPSMVGKQNHNRRSKLGKKTKK